VRPRVIVALGKFAAQTLLASTTPITRLRGHWHDYRGIKLMPTLHPAYLLRNPGDKRLVWEDVKQVMAELGMRHDGVAHAARGARHGAVAAAVAAAPPQPPEGGGAGESMHEIDGPVVLIKIDGSINPATVEYIRDGLRIAGEQGAGALVIQMDTPGGLLESTKIIVKDLLGHRRCRWSSTSLPAAVGRSRPASSSPWPDTSPRWRPAPTSARRIRWRWRRGHRRRHAEKVENFAASLSKTIAQERGRNVEWAEKAVRESVSITEKEALELGVIDLSPRRRRPAAQDRWPRGRLGRAP
jgi:hypothetical protein